MKNIVTENDHSFDLFRDYYQNIKDALIKDDKGQLKDPFGNIVRSLKVDELGQVRGLYARLDYGDTGVILYGRPEKEFHIQGNHDGDMYAYTFDRGVLIEKRKSNKQGYIHRKYSHSSNGNPIFEVAVHHAGPFVEKHWTEDGKTLIHKKTSFMDQDLIQHISTEFLDKNGQKMLRTDLRLGEKLLKTEMYQLGPEQQRKLLWSCEDDKCGRKVFYDGQGRMTDIVMACADGKKRRMSLKTAEALAQNSR